MLHTGLVCNVFCSRCWRDPQRLIDSAEIVVHREDRDHGDVVLDFKLREYRKSVTLARVYLQVRSCHKKPANQSRGYRNYIRCRRLS